MQGQSPCINPQPNSFRPPSAASGAAQPPRPQGAGFRRKREPRGAGGRQKLVSSHVLKTSKKIKGYYSVVRYIIYCNSFLSFFNQHFPNTFYAGFNAQSKQRGFGGRVPRRGSGAEPLQMGRVPPIGPQGRRPFNAPLRLSAPYYSAAYPRTRIARRISHKIIGRGVDYDSPADYLRNGEALSVYRAESKSVV